MLRKFVDWWNQKPSKDAIGATGVYVEEEYKYETTLVRDLRIIADLLGKEFPKYISKSIRGNDGRRIEFRSEGYSIRDIKKAVNLKSFQVDQDYSGINVIYWSVNSEEYKAVYDSKYMQYTNSVRNLLAIVEKELYNPDYFYTFCKYEDSIHIVTNTLKDEHGNNRGEIGEEVFGKSRLIIDRLATAIMKKHKELEYIEKMQQEAVSKSLINRLDNEIEFINKYIEVN